MSKGSLQRGSDPESRKRYAEGWDLAFIRRRIVKRAKLKPYPAWVCDDCALAAGGRSLHECATYHNGICGVCLLMKMITEPRDFRYPRFPGHRPPCHG